MHYALCIINLRSISNPSKNGEVSCGSQICQSLIFFGNLATRRSVESSAGIWKVSNNYGLESSNYFRCLEGCWFMDATLGFALSKLYLIKEPPEPFHDDQSRLDFPQEVQQFRSRSRSRYQTTDTRYQRPGYQDTSNFRSFPF